MMNPRTAAAQPQSNNVPRKIALLAIDPKGTGVETPVPADAIVFGVAFNQVTRGFDLVLGVGEGSVPIQRKVWTVPVDGEASVEAQNSLCLGEVYLPVGDSTVVAVVFMEEQGHAIERARQVAAKRGPR